MYSYSLKEIVNNIKIGMTLKLKNGTLLIVIDNPEIEEDNQNIKIRVLLNNEEKVYSLNYLYNNELVEKDNLGVFCQIQRRPYKNHCWNCKESIDSRTNELCTQCNQHYICFKCGYCLCLYNKNKITFTI